MSIIIHEFKGGDGRELQIEVSSPPFDIFGTSQDFHKSEENFSYKSQKTKKMCSFSKTLFCSFIEIVFFRFKKLLASKALVELNKSNQIFCKDPTLESRFESTKLH